MANPDKAALASARPPRRAPVSLPADGFEERYRLLAENSRDMVAVISPSGRWSYVSPASKQLLGYAPDEMLGRDAYAYVHPDDAAMLGARLRRSIDGLPPPGLPPEFRMRRADGAWVWVEGTGGPLRQGDGPPSFQVTLRDITERRTALQASAETARRLRNVYETISEAFFQLDRDFRLVYMNPVAARMRVSGAPEQVYGKVLWEAFPDLKGSRYETEYRRAMRDRVPVTVVDHYARLGKWFEARAYPSEEGLSVYFTDITERKRIEATDRLAYERSLEIAALKEINQYKTAFVNTAAHELGNPLTPIRIQLRILHEALARGQVGDADRAAKTLDRNVERLVRLVNDILEGARLQASRLVVAPERVDLAALLAEAVDSHHGAATHADMSLRVETTAALTASADPRRVMQVLDNLLTNAVKYGRPGGSITVGAEARDGMAHVWVAGEGRGIPGEHLPHLFQPFSRVASDAGPPGSGLGLYICAGIVKNHGGQIWCVSDGPGTGATFHFTLPLAATPAPPPSAPLPAALPVPQA
jgi:PAS domain S-box-containing protein